MANNNKLSFLLPFFARVATKINFISNSCSRWTAWTMMTMWNNKVNKQYLLIINIVKEGDGEKPSHYYPT